MTTSECTLESANGCKGKTSPAQPCPPHPASSNSHHQAFLEPPIVTIHALLKANCDLGRHTTLSCPFSKHSTRSTVSKYVSLLGKKGRCSELQSRWPHIVIAMYYYCLVMFILLFTCWSLHRFGTNTYLQTHPKLYVWEGWGGWSAKCYAITKFPLQSSNVQQSDVSMIAMKSCLRVS